MGAEPPTQVVQPAGEQPEAAERPKLRPEWVGGWAAERPGPDWGIMLDRADISGGARGRVEGRTEYSGCLICECRLSQRRVVEMDMSTK